ncbi:hypothetical protein PHYNN_222 [Pantoea phage Phynn]|nr:hypothetical protein PHYNN_222 [Pantoea phage Phynn]
MSIRERRKKINSLIQKLTLVIPGVFVLVVVLLLNSCTDEKEAGRVLEANGYTDIRYTGHSWFSCAESDTYATGFIAKAPNGKDIEGTVCSGLIFKGSTIRF